METGSCKSNAWPRSRREYVLNLHLYVTLYYLLCSERLLRAAFWDVPGLKKKVVWSVLSYHSRITLRLADK